MKKILSILTAITLLASAATTACAFTPSNYAADITVYLNGENVYAGSDNQPCIMNDRTMVQIRPIFEKLGYTADYNESTQTAVFYGGGHNVPISFTNDSYTVNKLSSEDGSVVESINIDVPATLYNNSFYVPLRAFCETVGSDFISITWDNASRCVYLTSRAQSVTQEPVEVPTVKDTISEGEYSLYSGSDKVGIITVSNVSGGQATITMSRRHGENYELGTAYLQSDGTYVAEGYYHKEYSSGASTEKEAVKIIFTVNSSNSISVRESGSDTTETYTK